MSANKSQDIAGSEQTSDRDTVTLVDWLYRELRPEFEHRFAGGEGYHSVLISELLKVLEEKRSIDFSRPDPLADMRNRVFSALKDRLRKRKAKKRGGPGVHLKENATLNGKVECDLDELADVTDHELEVMLQEEVAIYTARIPSDLLHIFKERASGKSYTAICQELGISKGNLSSRLYKFRAKLKTLAGERGDAAGSP